MTTRCLVVGLGSIGQRHARNLRSLLGDQLRLSALRSTRRSDVVISDDLAQSRDDPTVDCDGGVYFDLDRALSDQPDIVVIATPTSLHLPVLRAALEIGAAVFVEKPISHDLEGVNEVMALAEDRNATVAVGCQLRFHPALQSLKSLTGGGAIGRVLSVRAEQGEYLPSYHPYEDYRQSYAARKDLGGGVVLTQIHELDYLQWIFGAPTAVYALGGTIGDLEIDVEDSVTALLACETAARPVPISLHLDYLQRPPRRGCVVTGAEGSIAVDLLKPSLTWTNADNVILQEEDYPDFQRSELFLAEMRHFLAAASTGSEVAVTLAEGARALRTAMAIKTSLSSGRVERP